MPHFESSESPEITDNDAIEILRDDPAGPKAQKWFDKIRAESDSLRQNFESHEEREKCARIDILMALRAAIIKFLAGHEVAGIEDLQEMGESSDGVDRVNRAVELMKLNDPLSLERLLEILIEIRGELY